MLKIWLVTMWRILQMFSATFQSNWTILNVSASGNPWFIIRYPVKLSFSVCLTYLICSILNALFPLISTKQLGWSHFATGSHLGWYNPVDFTHGANPFVLFLRGCGITGLSCQTWDRHLIKSTLLSCFSLSFVEPYHCYLTG